MRLVNGNDVEVWQGVRKLAAFEHKPENSGRSITHEIHDGRMISKPAECKPPISKAGGAVPEVFVLKCSDAMSSACDVMT
jgi:hypothetical protein